MVLIKNYEITKKQLDFIGEKIRNDTYTEDDIEKISDYRSEHSHLMRSLVWSIRSNKIIKENNGTIISQRLKRMPSIIKKIKRFDKMKVSGIQDYAGVRVIFDKIENVYDFANYLKNKTYKKNNKNNFVFLSEKNYIEQVKPDGYRSIHQIYKFQGDKYANLINYKIELQIRTKLQHQWATSVEILDLLEKSSLKLGEGKKEHQEFFLLASKLIEQIETNKYTELEFKEIINKLKKIDTEYKILSKLSSLTIIKDKLTITSGLLIMILNVEDRTLKYRTFTEEETSDTEFIKYVYSYYEKKFLNNENVDIVVVSMKNLKDLSKAYPNYLLDAKQFVKTINKYIN